MNTSLRQNVFARVNVYTYYINELTRQGKDKRDIWKTIFWFKQNEFHAIL